MVTGEVTVVGFLSIHVTSPFLCLILIFSKTRTLILWNKPRVKYTSLEPVQNDGNTWAVK